MRSLPGVVLDPDFVFYPVILSALLRLLTALSVKAARRFRRGPFGKKGGLWAIAVGGLIAGTLDLTQASILSSSLDWTFRFRLPGAF